MASPGKIEHELRKCQLALVHDGFGRKPAKNRQSAVRRSNRDQTETVYANAELTIQYGMCRLLGDHLIFSRG